MFIHRLVTGPRSALHQSSLHPKKHKSILTTASEGSVASLLDAETGRSRRVQQSLLARKILALGKEWPEVNWRQFALMHSPYIIRKTTFEGGEIGVSINAWQSIFREWRRQNKPFFDCNLTPKQMDAVYEILQDVGDFQSLLPLFLPDQPLSETEIIKLSSAFLSLLKQKLKKKKCIYLPLGYRHGIANEGHAISCKVVQKNGYVEISPLNLGNGSEPHPVLDFTPSQDQVSMRFFPFRVPNERLWGEAGHTAFCHILRYSVDPPHPEHTHYQGSDLYDILFTLGEINPDLGSEPENLQASSQPSGICPELAIKNIVYDMLLDQGFLPIDIQKMLLNMYLFSLIAGFHSYRRNPTADSCQLLKNAAEGFGLALKKLQTTITEEEYLGAQSVVHEIKALAKGPIVHAAPSQTIEDLQPVTHIPSTFPQVDVNDELKPAASKSSKEKRSESVLEEKELTYIDPSTFSKQLQAWTRELGELPPKEVFPFLYSCTLSLPLPVWGEKDAWDDIPIKNIPEVLRGLKEFLYEGIKEEIIGSYSPDEFFIEYVLVVHTVYAIADKLARRSFHTKLDGFASPFFPYLQNNGHDFTSIPIGYENDRYAAIEKYFSKSREAASGVVIFPIDAILPVEQFVEDRLRSYSWSQGCCHILYLQQFMLSNYHNASNRMVAPLYFDLWKDTSKTRLPEEVHLLYYFAFASQILFAKSAEKLPKELTFTEGLDQNSRKALLIKIEKKDFNHDLLDSRFREMEVSNLERIPLFEREMQSLTTNDAVCIRLSERNASYLKMSEPIYRDLLRISRKQNLKMVLALQWASAHLPHLEHPIVQQILDHCFFAPGLIIERLKQEPQAADVFRDFIQKGLGFYRNNPHHLSAILFLLRTGIFFETHAARVFGREASESSTLQSYGNVLEMLLQGPPLDDKQRAEVVFHWIFLQTQKEHHAEEEFFDFCVKVFDFHSLDLGNVNYSWLRRKMPRFIKAALKGNQELCSDSSFCNALCNALLQKHFPEGMEEIKDGKWKGHFPIYTCGEYEIHFLDRTISHTEKGQLRKVCTFFWEHCRWKELEKIHGSNFWESRENEYVSEDKKLRIDFTTAGMGEWEREISVDGESKWCRLFEFSVHEIDELKLEFLNDEHLLPLTHYLPLKKEAGDPDVVTFEKEEDTPYFRIDYLSKGMRIAKLDQYGRTLPIILVNLDQVTKKSKDSLYYCASRFSSPQHVLCFINTKTGEIEDLNFYHLKLRFKKSAEGLASLTFPGFILLPTTTLQEINHYQAAFVLQKDEQRKVILPAKKLILAPGDFSTEITPAPGRHDFFSSHYYVYDVDPAEGTLKNADAGANIYLALLLKMQRDYEKAAFYLSKAKSGQFFDYNQLTLLKQFVNLRDRTPAALAFDLNLLFFVVDNMNLMIEQRFGMESQFRMYDELLEWGIRAYHDYLQTVSEEDLSAIPKGLRLTFEKERAVLLALKAYHDRNKKELPQVLLIRLQFICSQKREVEAHIAPKTIKKRPPIYSSLVEPRKLYFRTLEPSDGPFPLGTNRQKNAKPWEILSYTTFPNRFSSATIEAHFPALFEKAKKCQADKSDPFDFTLLALLKVKNSSNHDYKVPEGKNLAQLLFYVRHFPHYFSDLSFRDASSDSEAMDIFNEIVKRLGGLESDPRYSRFKEEFLEATVTFDYEKSITLRSSPPDATPISLPKLKRGTPFDATPFRSMRKALFKKKTTKAALPEAPPFIGKGRSKSKSKLEDDLTQNVLEGYTHLQQKKTVSYTLRPQHLKSVEKELHKKQQSLHQSLIEKKKKIIQLANAPYKVKGGTLNRGQLDEEFDFRLAKDTQQVMRMSPELIMKEVILRNNPAYLLKNCPLLTKEDVAYLIYAVNDYYHTLVLYQLCSESSVLIKQVIKDPLDQEAGAKLAYILDYEFLCDPQEYPEISYFKVTNGKLPRDAKQAKTHMWVCEGLAKRENRCFQLPAGNGKTEFLTPLMMLRAKREHLMPVVFSTPAIYPVDKDNLGATLSSLGEGLCCLEVGLHMKLTGRDLKFIYDQLQQYHMEGRGLIMTPQTFYALKLMHRYAALKEKDEAKVKWLGNILHFFKTDCFQIMDEMHGNLDALTRSIFGIGDFFTLPEHEQQLYMDLMRPLLGMEKVLCEDGEDVATASRLKANLLGTPTKEEIKKVRLALAKHMAASSHFEIPTNKQHEFIEYWTNKKAPEPELIQTWTKTDKKKADLAALTGYFILTLLKQICKMRTELDHTPSIFPEEEFDTPCHNKSPSTAQFDDPYRTLALSAKGTFHRQLSPSQVRRLIEKFVETDWREQGLTASCEETPTSLRFKAWVADSPLEHLHLRDVCLSNLKQMEQITDFLKSHPPAIEYYLLTKILAQVGYCPEQLVCTPVHLLQGFCVSAVFSATPLLPIAYPHTLKTVKYDPAFEAEVVTEYCKTKNQTYRYPETPGHFFESMKKDPSLGEVSVMLDPGGFLCDMTNDEVSDKWLASSDLDGVLSFKEERSEKNASNGKNKIQLRMRDKRTFIFEGSNIEKEMEAVHLNWKHLKIGTFYDAAHTESTNILQKAGARAVIFGGNFLTSSRLAQTLMRLRGFLDEKMMQTVIWAFQVDLAKKILGKHTSLNGAMIFNWSINNGADEIEKRAILAAYQDIAFWIENIADIEIETYLQDPKTQILLHEKYEKGFVEFSPHNPAALFAKEKGESSAKVLWAYAEQRYNSFGYAIPFRENRPLLTILNEIIKRLEAKIERIATNSDQKFSKEVEQHCRLKRDTEQVQYRPRPFDPLSAEGVYGTLSVTDPEYPASSRLRPSARSVFKSPGLTDNLHFEQNQLLTAKNAGVPLNEQFIKPIDFFMIIFYEGQIWAEVTSNEIIATFLTDIAECKPNEKIKHQVLLVTANGMPCQRGHGPLKPQEEEIQKVLKSTWLKDLVIDAALLRGEVIHQERLLERLASWPDFEDFWKRTVEALPNPETANHLAISNLLKKLKNK